MTDNKLVKKDVGTQVLERVNQLCEAGFRLPNDYSAVNAVKASMLILQETVDKNKKPALEVCTPVSIQKALFSMVTQGIDVSRRQGYFICRGNQLQLHISYFGHILQVKRLFPDWSPVAHTIREGDEFVYTIDPATGKMKLVKHEQKLENLDKEFIGAYMYLPCADGESELYVMTRKQILKAWSKSSSTTLQTHKDFDEKMALKTIINSGCTKVINATPDPISVPDDEDEQITIDTPAREIDEHFVEFEEVPNTGDEKPQAEATQKQEEQPTETVEPENDDEF